MELNTIDWQTVLLMFIAVSSGVSGWALLRVKSIAETTHTAVNSNFAAAKAEATEARRELKVATDYILKMSIEKERKEPGPVGPAGPTGATGETGPAGAAGQISGTGKTGGEVVKIGDIVKIGDVKEPKK